MSNLYLSQENNTFLEINLYVHKVTYIFCENLWPIATSNCCLRKIKYILSLSLLLFGILKRNIFLRFSSWHLPGLFLPEPRTPTEVWDTQDSDVRMLICGHWGLFMNDIIYHINLYRSQSCDDKNQQGNRDTTHPVLIALKIFEKSGNSGTYAPIK